MVISGKLDHTHEVDERNLEHKQVRLSVKRKANSDVSERPFKIIRSELQKVEENNLTENDLKTFLSCLYFYYILKLYPAQNATSTSPWCAGVTEITYKLTNVWRTEELIL